MPGRRCDNAQNCSRNNGLSWCNQQTLNSYAGRFLAENGEGFFFLLSSKLPILRRTIDELAKEAFYPPLVIDRKSDYLIGG